MRRARRPRALEARVQRPRPVTVRWPARYLVGIDLGTTNTACAYVDTRAGRAIRVFDVPQLVAPGGRAAPDAAVVRLPRRRARVPAGSLDLPWAGGPRLLRRRARARAGRARARAAGRVGEVVALPRRRRSHGRDPAVGRRRGRRQDLAGRGVGARARPPPRRVGRQPSRAARRAGGRAHRARVVRRGGARADGGGGARAGLPASCCSRSRRPRSTPGSSDTSATGARVSPHLPLVLVVDVGGGTTDLSLIAARQGRGELALERVAVGEHLLLGGDNMDLALARASRRGSCPAASSTRTASSPGEPVPGGEGGAAGASRSRRRAPHGGRTRRRRRRRRAQRRPRAGRGRGHVLDGFFPLVAGDARPRRARARACASGACRSPPTRRSRATSPSSSPGSATAAEQGDRALVRPDAVLFNGGALEPGVVRARIADVIGAWHAPDGSWRPDGPGQRVAAARRGARRRLLRARAPRRSACASAAAPRAATTSGSAATRRSASCRAAWRRARPCSIEGPSSSCSRTDRSPSRSSPRPTAAGSMPGELIALAAGALTALPPIRTVLRFGRKLEERALPVQLEVAAHGDRHARALVSLADDGPPLAARVPAARHGRRRGAAARGAAALVVDPARLEGATRELQRRLRGHRRPGHADAPAGDRAGRRSRRVAAAGDPCAVGCAVGARAVARADARSTRRGG